MPVSTKYPHLTWPYSLEDEETFEVHVYRNSPEWDRVVERTIQWFHLPTRVLQDLYVGSYDVWEPWHLEWIQDQHPGCVLLY